MFNVHLPETNGNFAWMLYVLFVGFVILELAVIVYVAVLIYKTA